MIKQNMTPFMNTQNQKQLIMNLMIMYLDQAILKLYETYKKILGKG